MSASTKTTAPWILAVLSFAAFIALGMPDGVLGVAWPSIRTGFGLELDALGQLLICSTLGYLASSFGAGWLLARLGVGKLLGLSALITGLALLGYTLVSGWYFILPLGFAAGLGAGGIDAGLNSWVEAHLSHRVMQWLHGSFGIGVTLGPAIMTTGLALSGSWRPGYWVVAGIQLVMGLGFLLKAGVWDSAPKAAHYQAEVDHAEPHAAYGETLRQPLAWLSALLFFVYVGIELGMGHWAYTWLTEHLGLAPALAGIWTAAYWFAFTLGRFSAGFVTHKVGPEALLRGAIILLVLVSLCLALVPWPLAKMIGMVVLGFVIAPIFPSMVSTTSKRVSRRHAASTIGMQMAFAGLGVGTIPGIMGFLSRHLGLGSLPWQILVCALGLGALTLLLQVLRQRGASKE